MRRRLHVDLRFVISGGLALIAALVVMALTSPVERVAILVADGPLSPGIRLGDQPLREAMVEPIAGAVTAANRSAVADRTTAVAVAEGSPILESMLASDLRSSDVLAVTLEPGNAVQGDVRPGDVVDIYLTDEHGTRVIGAAVTVVDAATGSGGLGGSDVAVLLAVDRDLAPVVIAGMHTGALDLVRVGR